MKKGTFRSKLHHRMDGTICWRTGTAPPRERERDAKDKRGKRVYYAVAKKFAPKLPIFFISLTSAGTVFIEWRIPNTNIALRSPDGKSV